MAGSPWHRAASQNEAALHTLVEETLQILPLAGLRVWSLWVGKSRLVQDRRISSPSNRTAASRLLRSNWLAMPRLVERWWRRCSLTRRISTASIRSVRGRHPRSSPPCPRVRESSRCSLIERSRGSFDLASFTAGLSESLSGGAFRLVLVLDSAPVRARAACRVS